MRGAFCKHLVAVALVATGRTATPADEEPPVDLREYLSALDQGKLVDLLLERAKDDELFEARLRMDAARAESGPISTTAFRQAIDQAFVTHDYVDYRDMYDYASNVHAVVDTLRDLLADGHAEAVIDLTEHALDRAEDAVGYVDDSDGYLGGIAEDLQSLHLEACEAARPDPVELAAGCSTGSGTPVTWRCSTARPAPTPMSSARQGSRSTAGSPRPSGTRCRHWRRATSGRGTTTGTGSRTSWSRWPT